MRPACLPVNVAAPAKLIPLAVIKRSFVTIDILKCGAQVEYTRLPEETCVSREAPVAIQKQVTGITTKDVIHAQQITIAVPIIIKRTINERDPGLISLREILERFRLHVLEAKNRRIISKLVRIVDASHQISDITLSGCK